MEGVSIELLEAIPKLRSKWVNLFVLKTMDDHIVFRPTTKGEFIDFSETFKSIGDEVEDLVFKKCVVYPEFTDEEIDALYAGTVTLVADAIVNVSGFSNEEVFLELLEKNRIAAKLVDNQVIAVLTKAFPYLTIEDINNLDIQQYTYRLALAEEILGTTLTIQKQDTEKNSNGKGLDFEKENAQFLVQGGASISDFK